MNTNASRLPKKHVAAIVTLAKRLGPQPRYTLAVALRKHAADISMRTALDHINAAANEGLLQRVGDRLQLRERKYDQVQ